MDDENDANALFTLCSALSKVRDRNSVCVFSIDRSNGHPFGIRMRYEERFDAVLKSAAVVFAQRGYDRASIRDVAKAARMSVAGLYYYCKSKDELLFTVCYHSFDVLLRNLHRALKDTSDPNEQLRVFILNHFEYFLTHVEAMKVVSHEAGILTGELGTRVAEIKRKYYVRCQQIIQTILGETDSDAPHLRTTTLALFGMINWVYTWYRPGRDFDAKALADSMTDLFLHGVRSQAAVGPRQEGTHRG